MRFPRQMFMYYNAQKFNRNDSFNFSVPQLESMLTRKLTIRSAEHNVISFIYVKRKFNNTLIKISILHAPVIRRYSIPSLFQRFVLILRVYIRGGEPSRHSGPHCTHDIFSRPHFRFMRKEKNKVLLKI